MANKIYVGQEGAQELYRRVKALIPAVDQELDENSSNPISNSAVTNAFKKFGGYRKVNGTGADNHPDVQNPDPKVIYLVEDPNAPDPDHFYEWIWEVPAEGNPIWRCIGTATMDLEDYYTKDESDAIFATKDDLPTIDEHYAPDSSNAQSGIGVTEAVAGKADVSTTLAGYGISDAYTKAETDSLLSAKVDIPDIPQSSGNLAMINSTGGITDSGVSSTDVQLLSHAVDDPDLTGATPVSYPSMAGLVAFARRNECSMEYTPSSSTTATPLWLIATDLSDIIDTGGEATLSGRFYITIEPTGVQAASGSGYIAQRAQLAVTCGRRLGDRWASVQVDFIDRGFIGYNRFESSSTDVGLSNAYVSFYASAANKMHVCVTLKPGTPACRVSVHCDNTFWQVQHNWISNYETYGQSEETIIPGTVLAKTSFAEHSVITTDLYPAKAAKEGTTVPSDGEIALWSGSNGSMLKGSGTSVTGLMSNISETYAEKTEIPDISGKQDTVTFADGYDASTNPAATVVTVNNAIASAKGAIKNGGVLTDGASVTVPNNSLSTLTTSQSSLTLNVACDENEIPNFAVEITAGADVTLTVTKTVGSTTTTLKYAEAAGNTLESGKYYQVTCVGNCWTIAEFVSPS